MRVLWICVLAISFIHCSKKEDIGEAQPQASGYFLNTNESWHYEVYSESVSSSFPQPIIQEWTFQVVDKSYSELFEGNVANMEVFMALYYADNPDIKLRDTSTMRVTYSKNARRLVSVDEKNRVVEILADFSEYSPNGLCPTPSWNSRLKKLGKNYYRCYYNVDGKVFVEGLELGLLNCLRFPPVPPSNVRIESLRKFQYKSAEYSYTWNL